MVSDWLSQDDFKYIDIVRWFVLFVKLKLGLRKLGNGQLVQILRGITIRPITQLEARKHCFLDSDWLKLESNYHTFFNSLSKFRTATRIGLMTRSASSLLNQIFAGIY